jgi:branched-subunit amino acid ABC-type transport system permease component
LDLAFAVFLQAATGVATLLIISIGLAVIFGMMRVINLAHGEFLMLGAYSAIISVHAGLNIWLAMLVVAPVVVGIIGAVVERLIIRGLYGQVLDTMLATWGLSLALIGAMTMIFGNSVSGFSAPLGSIAIGGYRSSSYGLFLIGAAVVLVAGTWAVLRLTPAGLIARGTMQNAEMAAALGISPGRVYSFTFTAGAALSGLAGALIAPFSGVLPTMGTLYIARAFITVLTGGTAMLSGTVAASALLGSVSTLGTYFTTPVLGEVIMLVVAILLLRLLPQGITGRFFRRAL